MDHEFSGHKNYLLLKIVSEYSRTWVADHSIDYAKFIAKFIDVLIPI